MRRRKARTGRAATRAKEAHRKEIERLLQRSSNAGAGDILVGARKLCNEGVLNKRELKLVASVMEYNEEQKALKEAEAAVQAAQLEADRAAQGIEEVLGGGGT